MVQKLVRQTFDEKAENTVSEPDAKKYYDQHQDEFVNRTFDEVKVQLTARMAREAQAKEFDAYVKRLRERADVRSYDSELEKIAVPAAPVPAAMGLGVAAPSVPSSVR